MNITIREQVLAALRNNPGLNNAKLAGLPGVVHHRSGLSGQKYAKDKQVARCGNAVPPPFAEALVRANLPELCQQKEIAA
ncbi:Uncharacterised protein [Escherichia coli]|uniref:DNA (cytosine-5-)-methyltransferase n=1 Tax=Escherichia coli TaxID=562 RepID=A0A377BHU9_ECOLX|nr:Uncharacterised protein [Escherichia coli]